MSLECPTYSPAPQDRQLPYFHVRIAAWTADRIVHRVYLSDTTLYFIHLGICALDADVTGTQVSTGVGGGLLGGAVGQLAKMAAQARIDEVTKALRHSGAEGLRQLVDDGGPHFALEVADIRKVRLDPRGWWGVFVTTAQHAARLRLEHETRGKMTLDLLHIDDVTTAVQELPRIFKDDVTINLSWNSL
jgi:hypothetical protein